VPHVQLRYDVSAGTLAQDLAWADAVLYASSTVCLEAVAQGLPVVQLELGGLLDPDPLVTCSAALKWVVREAATLGPVLEQIETVSAEQFADRQQAAASSVRAYWLPATAERLEAALAR
jgi:hypothetical protein